MGTKKSVQFYLNKEQLDNAKMVHSTLQSSGSLPKDASIGMLAKTVFMSFVDDMRGKKKEEPEEEG